MPVFNPETFELSEENVELTQSAKSPSYFTEKILSPLSVQNPSPIRETVSNSKTESDLKNKSTDSADLLIDEEPENPPKTSNPPKSPENPKKSPKKSDLVKILEKVKNPAESVESLPDLLQVQNEEIIEDGEIVDTDENSQSQILEKNINNQIMNDKIQPAKLPVKSPVKTPAKQITPATVETHSRGSAKRKSS